MRDGNLELYVVRAEGGGETRLTRDGGDDGSPAWSPDGSSIAFLSTRDGGRDVYRMRPDGGGTERLTVGAGATKDVPAWSPDGTRLAFHAARGRDYDIEVIRVADRTRTRVAPTSAYEGLYAWSPDGRRMAFISGRDSLDAVYVADADGSHVRRLSNEPSLNPMWKPR